MAKYFFHGHENDAHSRQNAKWAAECEYLARLLETDGNKSVPADVVDSYFRCQEAGARRDNFLCLAHTLRGITFDTAAARASAIETLRAHAAALRPASVEGL